MEYVCLLQGKLNEKWSAVTKAAIAEAVLNLTRLDEIFRTPENCIKTATLWLALASLCVLDKEHVEKLSSGQWSKVSDTRPLCTNHDDGETPAVIQCEHCGSLCGDCDRFLHLNRKTRSHRRTVTITFCWNFQILSSTLFFRFVRKKRKLYELNSMRAVVELSFSGYWR